MIAKAIAAFIAAGGDRDRMNLQRWAETYRCTTEDVIAEYERQAAALGESVE